MSKLSRSLASAAKAKSKNAPSAAARRRPWIPLATATAATVSLAGCSGFGGSGDGPRLAPTPLPAPAAAPAATPANPAALSDQIKQYANNMNAAIDAQEKQKFEKMTQGSAGSVAAAPATQPAALPIKESPAGEMKITSNQSASADTPIVFATQTHETEPVPAASSNHVTTPPATHVVSLESPKAPEAVVPPAAAAETGALSKTQAPTPESESRTSETAPRTAIAMAAMAASAPPTESATPLVSTAEPTLDPLLVALRQRVQTHPQNLQYSLALNLLESAETGKAPEAVPGANPAEQKFLTDLTGALVALAVHPASPNASLSERAAPLLELVKSWQSEADLSLPKLSLASRVDSFGVYTPVEPRFETGKRHVVIIYCEVANFTAKKTEDGMFQTKLAQQDTLITDDGLLVWQPNPEDVEDISRNQRRDFYLVKKLTIPDTLAIGKYTLRMSVTDKLSNKVAMLAMPVEITPAK